MATFEECWRKARLRFPGVPALLVRDWAQNAFTAACEQRGWSFQRKEGSLDTLVSRTLSTTFTQGSLAITSAAGFVASDAGRQIKVASYPVYTIASVTNASAATLDQVYADVSGAATATIFNLYAILPTDFKRFLIVYDTTYQRIIPFWISQDELAVTDPNRTSSDSGARYLVSQGYSTATATLGQVRYEFWPGVTSAKHYPYLYYKNAPTLADTDTLPGVWSSRVDALILATQIEAAQWPGTTDQKNPYFNLGLADRLEERWRTTLHQLSMDDDNQYPEDLMAIHWARRYGGVGESTTLLRATDATLADYI